MFQTKVLVNEDKGPPETDAETDSWKFFSRTIIRKSRVLLSVKIDYNDTKALTSSGNMCKPISQLKEEEHSSKRFVPQRRRMDHLP